MKPLTELVARVFLGHIFLLAGFSKLGEGYAGTAGYMDSMGIPGGLLPAVIALEIVGAMMIIVGFKVRYAAFALAGFSVVAALIFHTDFADQMQMILFMKNISMAGGLLLLVVHGAGDLSLERRWMKTRYGQETGHAV